MFIINYHYSDYQLSRADCSKEIKADISIKSFSRNPRKSSGGKPTVNVCLLTTSLLSWWTMTCSLTWLLRMKRVKERRCFYIISSFSSGWNWFLIVVVFSNKGRDMLILLLFSFVLTLTLKKCVDCWFNNVDGWW